MKAIVSATLKPFSQEIKIDDVGTYVNIQQDHDFVCISPEQFELLLKALVAAAEAKGWRK